MKTGQQWTGWAGKHNIVLVAVCLGLPGSALAESGGTIHFTGMIVAPPFEVTPGARPMQTSALPSAHAQSIAGPAAIVTYAVQPNSSPVADVSLATLPGTDSADVAARFTDSRGRTLMRGKEGGYHLNGVGGVLSLVAKSDDASGGPVRVTVVTSYR